MRVTLRMPASRMPSGTTRYGNALAAALEAQGVQVRREREPNWEIRVGRWWVGGGLSARAARWMPPRGPLVHATTPYCNPHRAAHVVTVHDIMPLSHPHLYGMDGAGQAGLRAVIERALERTVVVTTHHVEREIRREFSSPRLAVVPLGVDHARFFPDPGGDPALRARMLNVLVVGSSEARRRLDLVAEAAADIPFVHLLHVGRASPPAHRGAAVRDERALAALGARATRLGQVPDERLRRLLSAADIVVHLSEAEGFGLPPLEALACGARVVASDVEAHREVLGDSVRYVPVEIAAVAHEFAAAWEGRVVESLFPSPAVRVARAAGYDWGKTAREMMAVYGDLV
ncbi:MAG: glycosyltransferase [Thermoplasmatota archaeon]